MAYKFSRGDRGFGDIKFESDSDTGLDFEENYIGFDTDGSTSMVLSGSRVGIGTTNPDYRLQVAGNIGVNEYIYHNGDADTLIRFNDDKIVLKAGNKAMVTMEEKASSPHEVTINDGSNNIDFVVKGNGSRGGNPGIKFDASTNKLGINGVGTPEESLHVDGNIKAFGNDVRIKIDGDTDSHPGLELYENGTRKWIIFNDYTNDNLNFKTNSNTRMSIEQDGNVGIGTTSPDALLHVAGDTMIVGTNFITGALQITGSGQSLITLHTRDADNLKEIVFLKDGNAAAAMQINSAEHFFLENEAAKDIILRTNNQNTIRVYGANQRVGINQPHGSTAANGALDVTGEVMITGSAHIENTIAIKQGSDPSTLDGYAHIYAKNDAGDAELFVRDEAGNVTKISPHNSQGEWEYFSKNTKTGKVFRVNMEKMIRKLEEITGESFIEEWHEDIK